VKVLPKITLSKSEILAGYDAVSQMYPHVPSLVAWRMWEYAAYQRYSPRLAEPVLDVGCGDGRFFKALFPNITNVTGIDLDQDVIKAAKRSGVYRDCIQTFAHEYAAQPDSFGSAFANCSLEHMDNISGVLKAVWKGLQPGAPFLLSVVTDKLLDWATLPLVMRCSGADERADIVQAEYEAYHHLMNPFSVAKWTEQLEQAGFVVEEHIPILPEFTGRFFLFLDNLWHLTPEGQDLGDSISQRLSTIPEFPQSFRQIVSGVLDMDSDDYVGGAGAVFWARKSSSAPDFTIPLQSAESVKPKYASVLKDRENQELLALKSTVKAQQIQIVELNVALEASDKDRAGRLQLLQNAEATMKQQAADFAAAQQHIKKLTEDVSRMHNEVSASAERFSSCQKEAQRLSESLANLTDRNELARHLIHGIPIRACTS